MIDVLEEWRPIAGSPGYEVSSHGRVRSVDREVQCGVANNSRRMFRGRILQPSALPKGYLMVGMGRARRTYVHALVAAAFIGPRPEGMEIAHNDGNPQNNAVENLRYATPSDNNRDKRSHGTDHNVRKTHCPRGHALRAPNLIRHKALQGWRCCRACSQAYAKQQRDPNTDFVSEADRRYTNLMGVPA